MKFFNTAGPVNKAKHYKINPLDRIGLKNIENLIEQEKYFVLHAPRQTGKTSCLLALRDHINKKGEYYCLYINVELGQSARNDVEEVVRTILSNIANRSKEILNDSFVADNFVDILRENGAHSAFFVTLSNWCEHLDKPLILLIDEIDALIGDSLVSVLRQLRGGYDKRPEQFPQSVVLCGVRDVRDYRIRIKEKEIITGGSAFNIKAESLRLGNFTRAEVEQLLLQHTQTTGQEFEKSCFDLLWEYTGGQPWLVNAIAYEVTSKTKVDEGVAITITTDMIARAKEELICRRDTHIDQLADKLGEERVRRIMIPILNSEDNPEDAMNVDDSQYLLDLGLIIEEEGVFRIANAIYREVIPRELTWYTQRTMNQKIAWYQNPDGSIDMLKLLTGFQDFFRKHSEHWMERFSYKEAGPQLLLQAFLQRIINGDGQVEREYGLGMKRTDLYLRFPFTKGVQEAVIELKIVHGTREETIASGLKQTAMYMDKCGTENGYLVLFDKRKTATWDERIFFNTHSFEDKTIHVWGM